MNMNFNHSTSLKELSIAVICDAENISYKHMPAAIKIASRIGKVEDLEAFGCWSCENNKKWEMVSAEHSIQLIDVKRATTRTDTVDKSISYRLCSLSENSNRNAIVLATSDSGYFDIISLMKKNGNILMGLGEEKTSKKYRHEFDFFYDLSSGFYETKIQVIYNIRTTCALLYMLRAALHSTANTEGWSQLPEIGHYLKNHHETWQEGAGGLPLLSLINYLGLFEVTRTENDSILVREQ